MLKLEVNEFPSRYLDCYESALINILKHLGLPEETPLMGTQAYFVLEEADLRIAPRFNGVSEEWKRVHGLEVKTISINNERELRNEIVAKLDDGIPLCLDVDIYYLPHTSHYNRLHQPHSINIYGYDDNGYCVVCPYYRVVDWLDLNLIHTGFFSPAVGDRDLVFIPELKLRDLSSEEVRALMKESCQGMLGLAIPEALADIDPRHLGLSGIRVFSGLLQKLISKEDENSRQKALTVSTQIVRVGYSRYWFHKLIQTCQQQLFPADVVVDLQGQFAGVVESWRAIGHRLSVGVYTNRYEMMEWAALRLEQVYRKETRLFNSLWQALSRKKCPDPT